MFLLLQGIIQPGSVGRPSLLVGPEPLHTVQRDPDGHGALDVTWDARPTVTSALLRAEKGRPAQA